MQGLEIGRVCIKTKGRESGKAAVIVDIENSFATVDGPEVKRKRCNIRHLFPTNKKIGIKKGAAHSEIIKLMGR